MPFILHRSVVNEVRPTVDIAQGRYLSKQTIPYHVDLLDELTFYGAMQSDRHYQVCVTYGLRVLRLVGEREDVANFSPEKSVPVTSLPTTPMTSSPSPPSIKMENLPSPQLLLIVRRCYKKL